MTSEAGLTALIIEGGMWIGSVRVRRLIPETTAQETFPHTRTSDDALARRGQRVLPSLAPIEWRIDEPLQRHPEHDVIERPTSGHMADDEHALGIV